MSILRFEYLNILIGPYLYTIEIRDTDQSELSVKFVITIHETILSYQIWQNK